LVTIEIFAANIYGTTSALQVRELQRRSRVAIAAGNELQWLELIQAEYREMPCLRLTKAQMQRMWGFDAHVCDALVDALVAGSVLKCLADGSYVLDVQDR
jgi:hypothetical protein